MPKSSSASSETIRRIAKNQARSAREGGSPLGLTNQDKIKLSQAALQNIMLANRRAKEEAQNTDSNNPEKK